MTKETYKVGQETSFLSALGEKINVLVQQINIDQDDNNQITELFFEIKVSFEIYQKIIQESLFNLFPEIGISAGNHNFENAPVEIQLKLKPSLINYLNQQMKTAQGLAGLINQDSSNNEQNNCLYYTENWLAITFKQLMSLPSELAEDGSLKQGYYTLWHNQELIKQKLTPKITSVEELIINFLNQKQWQYKKFNDQIFKLLFTTENNQWSFLIALNEENFEICCYSIYPDQIPPEKRGDFAIFITGVNYELTIGNFELDFDDGELRLRTSLPFDQEGLKIQILEKIININIETMNYYFPQFKMLQSS